MADGPVRIRFTPESCRPGRGARRASISDPCPLFERGLDRRLRAGAGRLARQECSTCRPRSREERRRHGCNIDVPEIGPSIGAAYIADTSSRAPTLDPATFDMAECANRANVGVGQPRPGPLQKLRVANPRFRCRCDAGADLRQSREARRIARTLHVPGRMLDQRASGHGRRLVRSP
jgi:hypothetical protein